MAEQLALDQFRGDGGAVDLDVGHGGAGALLVQAAGDQFLAAAVRTGDQHAGVGRGDLGDHLAYVLHCLGLADHLLAVHLLLENLGLGDERGLVRRVLDGDQDAVEVQGLLDEIEGALLDAVHRGVDVPVAGNHDHGGVSALLLEVLQDFHTVHVGHLDVTENDIEMLFAGHFQADGAVFGRFYLVPFVGEDFLERIADRPFVVDDQDLHNTDLKFRHLPPKIKISAIFPIFIPE